MNIKVKKRISVFLDVLLIVLMALVLFISVNAIVSKNKGYTSLFGNVVYAVETDSMKGDYKDSFDKNALIFCKELTSQEAKKSVKVGEVITFWFMKDGQKKLNTHRIVGIINENGVNCQYITKGDNKPQDADTVLWSDVVAVFDSKVDGLGALVLFAQSPSGFFVVAVVPSILLFGYCIVLFYANFKKVMDKKRETEHSDVASEISDAQREQIRNQILAELAAQSHNPGSSLGLNQTSDSSTNFATGADLTNSDSRSST